MTPARRGSGIAVSPSERLTVTLPTPAAGALAYVALGDSADLAVRVVSGMASFSSGIDRLAVETSDSPAVFRIVVPRGGPWISEPEVPASPQARCPRHGRRRAESAGTYLLRVPPRRP
jgi:hypothetical protein